MSEADHQPKMTLRYALAECRRADTEWTRLRAHELVRIEATLPQKEARHLTHTVFRINALLFLYSRLCDEAHDTRRGVVLGAITYLLDYVYDHHAASGGEVAAFEAVIGGGAMVTGDDPLAHALSMLASEAWRSVANPVAIRAHLEAMLRTQRESMLQVGESSLTEPALARLTRDKGHRSLCLYFAAVNPAFGADEARALERFGDYMQYMDDLEDYYEDKLEARRSPVSGPWIGMWEASRRFLPAHSDLRGYYGARHRRRYWMFLGWLMIYHSGIMLACVAREATGRLPAGVQIGIDRVTERLARRNPLFYVVPVTATYARVPRSGSRCPDPR